MGLLGSIGKALGKGAMAVGKSALGSAGGSIGGAIGGGLVGKAIDAFSHRSTSTSPATPGVSSKPYSNTGIAGEGKEMSADRSERGGFGSASTRFRARRDVASKR